MDEGHVKLLQGGNGKMKLIKECLSYLIPSKYDFIELICKVKNHELDDETLLNTINMEDNPNKIYITACKRCRFQISVQLDEDKNFYLISEFD